MRKTRDLFKKIRDTKGTFQAKTGTIKDGNGMDLTEAEEVKKSGKNTQKNYTQKRFNDLDNHDGVVTHLEPDILDWEVNGPQEASLETKLVEVMEFWLSYFKSWKMML